MSAVLGPSGHLARWRMPLAAFALLLCSLLLLYWNTLVAMVGIWYRSETFAHAFLVLPISLWLAWRKRDVVLALDPHPQPWLLLPMALVALVWLTGHLAGVNIVTQAMFTALLVLSVPIAFGLRVARVLAFPLLFLFFMVPVGEFMLPTMMDWTADFTVAALQLSGVPVYREGLQFVIPSGSWAVVEACSGVRYMIASFMVGTLFAYLNYTSMSRRLLFCGAALLIPLVANWVRAYFIVLIGHLSNNQLAVGVDHLVYGWVFFGIVIMVLFWVGARWAEPPASARAAPPSSAGRLAPIPHVLVALAAVAVLVLPHALSLRLNSSLGDLELRPLTLPDLPGTTAAAIGVDFAPTFRNPDAIARRDYAIGADLVSVHVAYYRGQGFGHKLVSSNNVLLKSSNNEWKRIASGRVEHAMQSGPVAWRSAVLLGGEMSESVRQRRRLDVRQIYWVDGRYTDSDAFATAYGLWGRLMGRGDDGAMVTIYTLGDEGVDTAARLDAFVRQHMGAIEDQLAALRVAP